jgi:hypothetical protein
MIASLILVPILFHGMVSKRLQEASICQLPDLQCRERTPLGQSLVRFHLEKHPIRSIDELHPVLFSNVNRTVSDDRQAEPSAQSSAFYSIPIHFDGIGRLTYHPSAHLVPDDSVSPD